MATWPTCGSRPLGELLAAHRAGGAQVLRGTVRGHTGGLPGYSSEIYTDATGNRSVAVFTSTNFGIKEEKAATTNKALVEAVTCQLLGKPQPSDSPAG